MNAVRMMLKQRLRHGMSRKALAYELKIHINTLVPILSGLREPTPKVLKALGLKRVVSYVSVDADTTIAHGRVDDEPVPETSIVASVTVSSPIGDTTRGKLTAERVQIAIRHGLNPGKAWSDFIATSEIDWLEYCSSVGTTSAQTDSPENDGALGKPGELYSHLGPVVRGPDQRTAAPVGIGAAGVRVVPREE